MQDVSGLAQELTCELLQLTLLRPLVVLVPDVMDAGVVPRREMMNPWQYPPLPGLVVVLERDEVKSNRFGIFKSGRF